MRLFTGVLCLCLAYIGFFVTLLGCRNPRTPRWASDFLVANLYSVGIITLLVFGVGQLILFASRLGSGFFPTREAWMAGAVLVEAMAAVKALRVRRTLAAYAAAEAGAREVAKRDDDRPEPPARPTRPRLAA